ncbi:MAG: hypothetical protein WA830_21260 [Candidatus Sulfotelmatobacter sp.]
MHYYSTFPHLFLEDVENFVWSAPIGRLERIEKAIARRKAVLRRPSNRRGRPREEHNPKWIAKACSVALAKHVEGLSWGKIAKREGMVPGKSSQRTLSRQRDDFAELVFLGLDGFSVTEKNLDQSLDAPKIRTYLQSKFGIPFESKKAEAVKVVRELFPMGKQLKRSIRELQALLK